MVFSSLNFIFVFLPLVLLLYYLAPRRFRNAVLFLASLFFYAWGEPVYIVLMLFSTLVDYVHGLLINRFRDSKNLARLFLLSSVVINLGLLGFFKYAGFLLRVLNSICGLELVEFSLPLPIGISFYTFQTMSYTIDVYRDRIPVQRNFIDFATYVSFFPQLIAGPIVRYREIAAQLVDRQESTASFGSGVRRFAQGLGKKVLLANNIGLLWQEVQHIPAAELTALSAWLGIVAFALQIYFDFSGYSDMAVGLGKMFGFTLPENFSYPYISRSITEFWRRWHMTLGSWFREYVYIPLGGNRKGKWKTVRNMFVVWLLTGLWHGAAWNFALWGLYYGALLALEKTFLAARQKKLPPLLQHTVTLFLVLFGWVFFVFEDSSVIGRYLQAMLGFGGLWDQKALYLLTSYAFLLLLGVFFAFPKARSLEEKLSAKRPRLYYTAAVFACFFILVLATAYLVDASFNPFLYFRF
mgnify:CR=1 FL=1|jgi:alginate O-acetyltransferase complex protein AlgI